MRKRFTTGASHDASHAFLPLAVGSRGGSSRILRGECTLHVWHEVSEVRVGCTRGKGGAGGIGGGGGGGGGLLRYAHREPMQGYAPTPSVWGEGLAQGQTKVFGGGGGGSGKLALSPPPSATLQVHTAVGHSLCASVWRVVGFVSGGVWQRNGSASADVWQEGGLACADAWLL